MLSHSRYYPLCRHTKSLSWESCSPAYLWLLVFRLTIGRRRFWHRGTQVGFHARRMALEIPRRRDACPKDTQQNQEPYGQRQEQPPCFAPTRRWLRRRRRYDNIKYGKHLLVNNAKETMVIVPLSLWLDLWLTETNRLRPVASLVFVACQK